MSSKSKYELNVDYGKPYTEFPKDLKALKSALQKLQKYAETTDVPYMDITIFDLKKEKDVTDKIFKKLRLN